MLTGPRESYFWGVTALADPGGGGWVPTVGTPHSLGLQNNYAYLKTIFFIYNLNTIIIFNKCLKIDYLK